MKKIQILGTGCPKCTKLYQAAEAAVKSLGIDCELDKVSDINDILAMGVMVTPALVIDGVVKSSGKLLSEDEIKAFLA